MFVEVFKYKVKEKELKRNVVEDLNTSSEESDQE